MNPLRKNQVKLLGKIGCADLARKIDELVKVANLLLKKEEEECLSKAQDEIIKSFGEQYKEKEGTNVIPNDNDEEIHFEFIREPQWTVPTEKVSERNNENNTCHCTCQHEGFCSESRVNKTEDVSERNEKDCINGRTEEDNKRLKAGVITGRNALIDELVQETGEMYDPDTRSNESRRGYDEAIGHFIEILKSKKK